MTAMGLTRFPPASADSSSSPSSMSPLRPQPSSGWPSLTDGVDQPSDALRPHPPDGSTGSWTGSGGVGSGPAGSWAKGSSGPQPPDRPAGPSSDMEPIMERQSPKPSPFSSGSAVSMPMRSRRARSARSSGSFDRSSSPGLVNAAANSGGTSGSGAPTGSAPPKAVANAAGESRSTGASGSDSPCLPEPNASTGSSCRAKAAANASGESRSSGVDTGGSGSISVSRLADASARAGVSAGGSGSTGPPVGPSASIGGSGSGSTDAVPPQAASHDDSVSAGASTGTSGSVCVGSDSFLRGRPLWVSAGCPANGLNGMARGYARGRRI